ncbi:nucleotidyltransferase [Fusobacterium sp. IOR10]|uniref:nucleotidyltransferase n=1 Tax=Fusobacterium sp. IOR10 TaxID=2665157 RepID=UPI0013D26B8F|nr:nucleotidyltransferase [Fusobacterium sp. IOR10]
MKSIGIIVEYNPFHNGHKLHLDYARKQGDIVIGVMSGDFVQRGEPALINKWDRAKMALLEGLDIVVELPVFYSTQSAEIFARGSINILKELRSDEIVFGSESDNLDKLQEVIKLESNSNFIGNVKKNLKDGDSYPTAYNKEIKNYLGEEYEIKSNDILGIEYLRTIKTLKLDMKVKTLKREGKGYHSSISTGNILSATGIRKLLKEDKDIENFISKNSKEIILKNKKNKKLVDISHFYNLIRYAIISKREVLKDIQDIEVGFENRIYEMALKSSSYEIFMKNLMTKRYTIGRTQRILIHILLSITKEDTIKLKKELPYIRILGFSDKGRTYLNKLKKEKKDDLENSNIQILTSLKNIKKKLSVEQLRYLELNEESSLIYRMINNYEDRKIPLMKRKDEYEIR